MNWLLISVLIILIVMTGIGYWRGFIRILVSLVSMLVLMVLVAWLNPYIADFIKGHTEIYEDLTEYCSQKVQDMAEGRIEASVEEHIGEKVSEVEEEIPGITLPELWTRQLIEKTGVTVTDMVEGSGIYRQVGAYLADWALRGFSFLVSLVLAAIVLHLVIGLLDIVSKLPVVNGVNRMMGGVAGLLIGVVAVWLLMLVIAIACTSQFGQNMLACIEESGLLTFLYKHNPILYLFR